MNLWEIFSNKTNKTNSLNKLHDELIKKFPQDEEQDLILMACLAGLLARVAHVDFSVCENEKNSIKSSITKWCQLNEEKSEYIATLAIKEMQELRGLDSRNYCTPLVEHFDIETRYKILEALFELAASDGEVDNLESNEINYISKSLKLEHKYFVSAKATVYKSLKAIKNS